MGELRSCTESPKHFHIPWVKGHRKAQRKPAAVLLPSWFALASSSLRPCFTPFFRASQMSQCCCQRPMFSPFLTIREKLPFLTASSRLRTPVRVAISRCSPVVRGFKGKAISGFSCYHARSISASGCCGSAPTK